MSSKKTIIVISRQYGSGGRDVGKNLAQDLGIAYYDKALIARAAQESGLSEEFFEKEGEAVYNPFTYLFSYVSSGAGIKEDALPVADRGFLIQSKVIKGIAANESCVIIGRCADYILEGVEDFLNVFIHADFETRIARVMERNDITDRDVAITRVKKTDKNRATYYQHYTDKRWGLAANYDTSISTSSFGVDGAVELIKQCLEIEKLR
ncbi:MAG: cytidylate kinase-like family protein [Actinobacteria bacterium]|nr:cytidylate kinase-like family protein [Actinomycetota bacterium]